jgi:catechol 2,3-dioxygenase-like lactoylglutathione lyase family enzyme
MILSLDHLQIAIPRGGEGAARRFYCELLGMAEVPKPEELHGRGGLWLRAGTLALHLGVDDPFVPARKAHPGLRVVGFAALCDRLQAGGVAVTPDDKVPGVIRAFVADPFGNRLELIDDASGSPA